MNRPHHNLVHRTDDLELLDRVRETADVEAFHTLYERYWETLFRLAWQKLGTTQDAADLVQEVFAQIWEKRASLSISIDVRAYLFTALRNSVFNYFKHKNVCRRYEQTAAAADGTTEVAYHYKELQDRVIRQVGLLPEKMREIFLLSREHHLSNKEIASRLRVSEQTVRNQICDALRRLRVALKN